MKGKLKALGVAAIAVFAMSAVVASAAQAEGPNFTATEGNYPVTLTGKQTKTHKFTVNGGSTSCSTATFSGSQGAAGPMATLEATYSGCKLFGLFNASVNMHGCEYTFNLVTNSSPATATVDIVNCNAGETITVSSGVTACVVSVPEQTGLAHVILSNTGSGTTEDIDANITVSGIHYTESAECPEPGTHTNGTYTGEATVQGVEEGVMVG